MKQKQGRKRRFGKSLLAALLLLFALTPILISPSIAAADNSYNFSNETRELSEDVYASGTDSRALEMDNAKVTVTGVVSADGDGAIATYMKDSSADITGDVLASGDYSYALYMSGSQATISCSVSAAGEEYVTATFMQNASADITGDVLASGDNSYALYMSDSQATIGGSVEAVGRSAQATVIYYSSVDIAGNVLASGDSSYALQIQKSDVTIKGSVTVLGEHAYAVFASGGNITISGGVTAIGYQSTGVRVLPSYGTATPGYITIDNGVLVSGDESIGVHSQYGSTVIIAGGVTAVGEQTTAFYAEEKGIIEVNGGVIDVSGENSTVIRLDREGTVKLDNVTAIADSRGWLLTAERNGVLTATASDLYGDIINNNEYYDTYMLDITLNDASTLTGTVNDAGAEAITNLTLADSGSVWHVTGDSLLNGALENSGTVSFANTTAFTTLTVADLFSSGSADIGAFVMKADVVNQAADQLVITGVMNGSQHNIAVINQGNSNTEGSETTKLVDTADSTGVFQLTNDVELGGWLYGLRQVNGGQGSVWELYGLGRITSAVDAGANTFMASYLLAYVETQTLIQRLGDLRDTPHLSGFWFRGHGGKFEVDSGKYVQPFDMDYWGVQLGYDRKYDIGWDGDFYAGVMFGYSNGDISLASGGNGDAESKTVGVYGTFIHANGFFADLVLKYQWIDNDLNISDSAGVIVKGNGLSSNGFGVSLELGQRVHFIKDRNTGWYIEPQAQLSYMRQGGGDVTLSNGLRVGAEPFTSILGRLGMLVGYETEKTNFYAKASKVKEFDGDMTITANSSSFGETAGDSWWAYGLGFTSRINERNSFYLDIERASGGFFEQTWAVKAGWRTLF